MDGSAAAVSARRAGEPVKRSGQSRSVAARDRLDGPAAVVSARRTGKPCQVAQDLADIPFLLFQRSELEVGRLILCSLLRSIFKL